MSGVDLLVLAREFDLPPRWEGCIVTWTPWEAQIDAFICPPPKKRPCCPGCGSAEPAVLARGRVALRSSTTQAELDAHDESRARLGSLSHKRKSLALWRLHAFRCQDCRHDHVWDTDTDEWWDLDHTDYGAEGST